MAGVHLHDQVTGPPSYHVNEASSDIRGCLVVCQVELPGLLTICHMTGNVYRLWAPHVQAATTQARKGLEAMARTAVEADPRLIAFILPSIPESVQIARLHVRTALGSHGLADYAEDAEIITSELVTNAVQHVRGDGAETIGVTLARTTNPLTVTVIVSDSSADGPVLRDTPAGSERGRGLKIVEALSAHWGWRQEEGGKAIFAVLARET